MYLDFIYLCKKVAKVYFKGLIMGIKLYWSWKSDSLEDMTRGIRHKLIVYA